MSHVIKSTEPCPLCLLQSRVNNPLQASHNQSKCSAGHTFSDTEELRTASAQARAQFPQLYQGPAAPIPMDPSIMAAQDIVITAEMKRLIEEAMPAEPDGTRRRLTGASDIKGLVVAYAIDNKEKDDEIRRLNATLGVMRARPASAGSGGASLAPGQFLITIPEWALEGVVGQAEHSGKPMQEWLQEEIEAYMENYFGAPAGGKR